MSDTHLVTLDPGHFHAALVQKEMYAGVARQVHVYAPLGADLLAHVQRIAGFNARAERPTAWELEIHTGPDFLERMLRERPGNVVVLAGRNRAKIDYILAAVRAGLNVLADKPWVIRAADLPRLAEALDLADRGGLVAYDIMTERYEITSILQRELVQDADVFGEPVAGSPDEPGVFMESVHYLAKQVAGVPLRRPAWFFDIQVEGEGLADVGTHLVDLVPWILFPNQALDYPADIRIHQAARWPTVLSLDEFQRVTGEPAFPQDLADTVQGGRLQYYCNNRVDYSVRGVWTRLNILWDYEAALGAGDTHLAIVRGTRSRVEVRQGAEQNYRPELYVVPNRPQDRADLHAALRAALVRLEAVYPGLGVAAEEAEFRLEIPPRYRVGHEAHFAEVTRQFLEYLRAPRTLPAWERPNMLAKYYLTTQAVEQGRTGTSPVV